MNAPLHIFSSKAFLAFEVGIESNLYVVAQSIRYRAALFRLPGDLFKTRFVQSWNFALYIEIHGRDLESASYLLE